MFYKTKDKAPSPLPFRGNRLCNLKARRACQIIAGGEQILAEELERICYPFQINNLEPRWRGCNLKARRACQIIVGDEQIQSEELGQICYPFQINNLEPRWHGCNLKARRACQIIAGGERSVTPGKPVLILFHPEGVAESFNQ